MATSNQRDVRLGVEIETAGEESLKRLAAEVRALAKEGGDAAPEYNRLATELERLGQQAKELDGVRKLGADLAVTNAEAQEAVGRAAALAESYQAASSAARTAAEAQAAIRAQLDATAKAIAEAVRDQALLRNGLKAGTVSAEEGAAANKRLADSLADLRARQAGLAIDLRNAKAETSAAVSEQNRLAVSSERAAKAAQEAQAALRAQAQALGAAQTAVRGLATESSNAAVSQERLDAAIKETVAAVARNAAATAEMADLDRQAAVAAAKLTDALQANAAAYERDEAALRGAAAAQAQFAQEALRFVEAEEAAAVAADKAARRVAELNAQAERTAQADKYVREVAAAFNAVEQQANEAAAATQKLQSYFAKLGAERDLVEKAFGATGVRSIRAIELEMFNLQRSLVTLQSEFRAGSISVQDFERASGSAALRLAALKREIATIPGDKTVFATLADGANNLITKFGALTAAVATAAFAVKPLIDAYIQLDQVRRVLTTVSGSAESAAQQIDFLRRVSQQSGQAFTEIAGSYSKFAASALQSGLSLQQVQDVFKSVSLAAGNLGLSSDQAKRALEALSQIASKGTVGMEELRQQLGDALPGVLPLLAKELGLTQRELNKVVESGGLLAYEAIPAIGRALVALQPQTGVVNGLVAEWNRFLNVVKQAGTEIVEGPVGKVGATVLTAFAGATRDLSVVLVGANEAFKVFGLSALSVLDALRGNITFAQLRQQISDFAEESGARLAAFKDNAYSTGEALTGLAQHAKSAGDSYAKLALQIDETNAAAELGTRLAEKRAQAAETEAEAVQKTVALMGEERAALDLTAEAADRVAAARAAVAAAAVDEATKLRAGKAIMLERIGADEEARKGIEQYIKATDEKIKKADADAEKQQALAEKTRLVAENAKLAAEMFGDQSGKIDELRVAVEAAERAYESTLRSFRKGKADTDDLRKASDDLARAKKLLRDAIDDVSAALERNLKVLRADAEFARASLNLELERMRTAQQQAIALGQEERARQAGLRIKELEVAISRTSIDLKRQEAEARLRELDAIERNLRVSGLLTAEKQAEIDARRKSEQAIVLETLATDEQNKRSVEQIEALRRGAEARGEHTKSVEGNSGSLRTNTVGVRDNTLAIEGNSRAVETSAGAYSKAAGAADAYFRAMRSGLMGQGPSTGLDGSGISLVPGGSTDGIAPQEFSGRDIGTVRGSGAAPGSSWYDLRTGKVIPGDVQFTSGGGVAGDGLGGFRNIGRGGMAEPNAVGTGGASLSDFRDAPSGSVRSGGSFYIPPPDNSGDWVWMPAPNKNANGGSWQLTPEAVARRNAENAAMVAAARVNDPGGFNGAAGYSPFGSYERMAAARAAADRAAQDAASRAEFDRTTPTRSGESRVLPGSGNSVEIKFNFNGVIRSAWAQSQAEADALLRAFQESFARAGGP